MTGLDETGNTEESESATSDDPERAWLLWARRHISLPLWSIGILALVILGIGTGIGTSGGVAKSEYDRVQADLAGARQRISDLKGDVASAKADARGAERVARNRIEAEFASKSSALDTREASLTVREQQLKVLEEAKKKDVIDGAGLYEVGVDINPEKWKTDGGSGTCYYAKLRSSDTSNIIDNNNVDGPAVAMLASGQYFEVGSRCAAWRRTD